MAAPLNVHYGDLTDYADDAAGVARDHFRRLALMFVVDLAFSATN
jgi:hypothetical protein